MHKQFKYHLTPFLKIFLCELLTWTSTTMSFIATSNADFIDSNNERYKAELAKRCAKTEVLLWEQEEKERLEH